MEEVASRTVVRTCPLCEAGCGLEITLRGDRVERIRGDRDDVFSHGFLCPKGSSLKQLHDDPDRLRQPLVRRNGVLEPATWDEAWSAVEAGLGRVAAEHSRNAFAIYLGNPGAHNLGALTYSRAVIRGLGTANVFSASTVDQMPKQVASGYLFGSPLTIAVPDLDRTDHLLLLGANPYESNGSLCTAPDFPGRIEAIRARGGKVVVVDPRRSRTARAADEWIAVRPGTDAAFLAAIALELVRSGRADPGDHVRANLSGWDEAIAALSPFDPDVVAPYCGVDAATIRRTAHELADARTAAVYGRIGTCTTEFGTTASWLVDVVNILTGNLDRVGGAMFPKPVAGGANTSGAPGRGRGFRVGRRSTRVSGLPEVCGEFPVAALAEEITTSGQERVRALVTVAGNPVLSTPNPDGRLEAALAELDFMVSVDIYLNETTRFADVILPPPSSLERSHYDLALLQFAVRNVANYSAPVLPRPDGWPDEWEILVKLGLIASGVPAAQADVGAHDDEAAAIDAHRATLDPASPFFGADAADVLATISAGGRRGPERLLDLKLRSGPFRTSLDELLASPHGIDFGALEPRLPEVLRTASGTIELATPAILDDLVRLAGRLAEAPADGELLLVGRRHLRSNNSWMHNLEVLVRGKDRCTLQLHPADAERLGMTDGDRVVVSGAGNGLEVTAEVTDDIRQGVVSLPHGWGHDGPELGISVASRHAGVNSNRLTPNDLIDPLSGTSVLNALPVQVTTAG